MQKIIIFLPDWFRLSNLHSGTKKKKVSQVILIRDNTNKTAINNS